MTPEQAQIMIEVLRDISGRVVGVSCVIMLALGMIWSAIRGINS